LFLVILLLFSQVPLAHVFQLICQATGQVDWLAAVEVQAAGMKLTQQGGPCRSRKEAEQEAAERALERLLMAVDGHAGC
jgi:dsRNA-specific ribonuclease